jgi:hypothetical protein
MANTSCGRDRRRNDSGTWSWDPSHDFEINFAKTEKKLGTFESRYYVYVDFEEKDLIF